MTTEIPIACSLSAAELPRRLAEMSAVGRDALLATERTLLSATLRFRRADQTRERLAAIVSGESSCCPFLDMRLCEGSDEITLTISAPTGADPVLDDLVAAFGADLEAA